MQTTNVKFMRQNNGTKTIHRNLPFEKIDCALQLIVSRSVDEVTEGIGFTFDL